MDFGGRMKRFAIFTLVVLVGLFVTGNVLADDKEECKAKCEAASKMIKENGIAAAMCEINKKDGQFVKGSIYVFLQNMDGIMLGHPIRHDLIGKKLTHLKDVNNKEFFQEFIKVAKDKGSGWVDYMWPKKKGEKPSKKISYILKIEGTDYFVGAGVYSD